jgi:hypothetical protein
MQLLAASLDSACTLIHPGSRPSLASTLRQRANWLPLRARDEVRLQSGAIILELRRPSKASGGVCEYPHAASERNAGALVPSTSTDRAGRRLCGAM